MKYCSVVSVHSRDQISNELSAPNGFRIFQIRPVLQEWLVECWEFLLYFLCYNLLFAICSLDSVASFDSLRSLRSCVYCSLHDLNPEFQVIGLRDERQSCPKWNPGTLWPGLYQLLTCEKQMYTLRDRAWLWEVCWKRSSLFPSNGLMDPVDATV